MAGLTLAMALAAAGWAPAAMPDASASAAAPATLLTWRLPRQVGGVERGGAGAPRAVPSATPAATPDDGFVLRLHAGRVGAPSPAPADGTPFGQRPDKRTRGALTAAWPTALGPVALTLSADRVVQYVAALPRGRLATLARRAQLGWAPVPALALAAGWQQAGEGKRRAPGERLIARQVRGEWAGSGAFGTLRLALAPELALGVTAMRQRSAPDPLFAPRGAEGRVQFSLTALLR